jgi:hypothetical protein
VIEALALPPPVELARYQRELTQAWQSIEPALPLIQNAAVALARVEYLYRPPPRAFEQQTPSGIVVPRWPRTSPYGPPVAYVRRRADVLLIYCQERDLNPWYLSNTELAELLDYSTPRSMEESYRQRGVKAQDVKLEAYYLWRRWLENSSEILG